MKLKPLGKRVLIQRDTSAEYSEGGIFLPGSEEKPLIGTVLEVGEGDRREDGTVDPLPVGPGDRVLFAKYGAMQADPATENLVIMKIEDVIARVFDEKAEEAQQEESAAA